MLHHKEPDLIMTDASMLGWGTVCQVFQHTIEAVYELETNPETMGRSSPGPVGRAMPSHPFG